MATEKPVSFDDLEPIEDSNDDYDDGEELIRFEVGEPVLGVIVEIERDLGPNSNSMVHLARDGQLDDRIKFWSNGQIDRKIRDAGLGNGDWLGVCKLSETDTFENDDGEEVEYHLFDVRAPGGN